jgi:type IV secretion system protein VirB1
MSAAAKLLMLARMCAPAIDESTTLDLVSVESSFNPYAIGVVGAVLERQPRNRAEALATIAALERAGYNYSVGLAQINRNNFQRLGLTAASALDKCTNLAAMETILIECYERASAQRASAQRALRAALSCYYSGNFQTGFDHGYVARVVQATRSRTLRRATREVGRSDR